jgi:probable phosphoglycerate mutase
LVAVRHGRTAWNAERRFQGHTEVPLDATGMAQAAALAAHLRDEPFDAAISSDLTRALSTAERIAREHPGLEVQPDARWREMMFGAWEGLTWPEITQRFPGIAAAPNAGGAFVTPPEGESFEAVCARVSEAVASLSSAFRGGGTVLVATHAGPLHALLRVVLGADAAAALQVRFEPASLTRLRLHSGGAELLELNLVPAPASAGA